MDLRRLNDEIESRLETNFRFFGKIIVAFRISIEMIMLDQTLSYQCIKNNEQKYEVRILVYNAHFSKCVHRFRNILYSSLLSIHSKNMFAVNNKYILHQSFLI